MSEAELRGRNTTHEGSGLDSDIHDVSHYGGEANIYETIKVEEATGLTEDHFLATAFEYMSRWKNKNGVQDLYKCIWWTFRRICREQNGVNESGVTILTDEDKEILNALAKKASAL